MPNQPRTPSRNFRVHDDVWNAAAERAEREGTNITAILVARLERYGGVKTPPAPPPTRRRKAQDQGAT